MASARPRIYQEQNEVLYVFRVAVFLLAGLEVPLSSLLFTIGLVFLLMVCTSAEVVGLLCSCMGFLLSFLPIEPM